MPHPHNVDPRETDKFSRLAALWWDPRGPMYSLHSVNPLRAGFITRDVDVRGLAALDVGCGGGLLTEALARLGAIVTGIDQSEDLLDLARHHAGQQSMEIAYWHVSAEQLALQRPGTYDIVTCMEVLEHVPRPDEVVGACSRLLKPGGHAFFSTIDRSPKSFVFAIVGAEYILRLLPPGSHAYRHLIRPRELRLWAEKHDMQFVGSAGVVYNLLSRKFSIAENLDVNYLMHFIRS